MKGNPLEARMSFSLLPNRNTTFFRVFTAAIWVALIFPSISPPISDKAHAKETNRIRKEMTLAACVFLAVRHNRGIESAYLDRVVQKFDLKVAEDEFIPDLTITPSIKHQSTGDGENRTYTNSGDISAAVTQKLPTGAQFSFTWDNTTGRTDDGDVASDTYGSSWQLSFEQPLLKGRGIDVNTVSLKTARINEQLNVLSLKSTISDIITNAIVAYRSFIQAKEQLEITRRSVARTKEPCLSD